MCEKLQSEHIRNSYLASNRNRRAFSFPNRPAVDLCEVIGKSMQRKAFGFSQNLEVPSTDLVGEVRIGKLQDNVVCAGPIDGGETSERDDRLVWKGDGRSCFLDIQR